MMEIFEIPNFMLYLPKYMINNENIIKIQNQCYNIIIMIYGRPIKGPTIQSHHIILEYYLKCYKYTPLLILVLFHFSLCLEKDNANLMLPGIITRRLVCTP